jgi:hypothetical protein
MTEAEIFIEGWKRGVIRTIEEIETYSAPWLNNGPSKATAGAILKKIKSIPIPRAEETTECHSVIQRERKHMTHNGGQSTPGIPQNITRAGESD